MVTRAARRSEQRELHAAGCQTHTFRTCVPSGRWHATYTVQHRSSQKPQQMGFAQFGALRCILLYHFGSFVEHACTQPERNAPPTTCMQLQSARSQKLCDCGQPA
eukprot:TRINITY_DN106897_c0_g1_i1.p2 TRINITY_DN106897_c0_g1~~TRINITY_DN106897_c0_g1_i1.p2  ORF type:complete len:105 (-),score=11.03 TRINITY_DN106897_c0_g1_i1:360-674(-)